MEEKRTYYQRNKERIRKQRKGFYKRNKERIKQRNKEWYEKNREFHQSQDIKKKRKEYRHCPEVLGRRREYQINRKREKPTMALKGRLSNLLWSALKHYSPTGKIRSSKKYGIDINAIIEHLKPFPTNLSDYEVHHIKPLFTFDFNNPEEIKKAFAP
ncbi:unnamed protein product, partial [marine sediment metagenome]